MNTTAEDATIVCGVATRTRYSCRDLAEVDAHLHAITDWLGRQQSREQWTTLRRKYGRDLDILLDARTMIAALGTLDDDLNALAAVPA